jgi:hypothetical protein
MLRKVMFAIVPVIAVAAAMISSNASSNSAVALDNVAPAGSNDANIQLVGYGHGGGFGCGYGGGFGGGYRGGWGGGYGGGYRGGWGGGYGGGYRGGYGCYGGYGGYRF